MLSTERHFSRGSRDVCRAVPAHHQRMHERLNPFSKAGPAGVMSSWASPTTFSPPVHPPSVSSALDYQDVQRSPPSVLLLDAQPSRTMQLDSLPLSIPAHLEDRGRPTAVLGSRHKGIDSEAGTSPSRTARRTGISPFLLLPIRLPRCRLVVVKETSLALGRIGAGTFLSSSDDFPITTSRSSGLLLSQISNLPDVSLALKDAKTHKSQVDAWTTAITFSPGVVGASPDSIGRSVSR